MNSYKEIQENLAHLKPAQVIPVYKYRAYKDGCCKIYETKSDAEQYSNLVERFMENAEEYQLFKMAITEFDLKVDKKFREQLRNSYPLSDDAYDIVFSYAHTIAGNYNDIKDVFEELYDMTSKLYELKSLWLPKQTSL